MFGYWCTSAAPRLSQAPRGLIAHAHRCAEFGGDLAQRDVVAELSSMCHAPRGALRDAAGDQVERIGAHSRTLSVKPGHLPPESLCARRQRIHLHPVWVDTVRIDTVVRIGGVWVGRLRLELGVTHGRS